MTTYRIVRFYGDHPGKDTDGLPSGLSLAEAQAWCNDPETKSETATSMAAQAVTAALGPWFDGYTEES